jgi:hypothetical protein
MYGRSSLTAGLALHPSMNGLPEYALTCTGDRMMPSSIPSPDTSLDCTVIPVPTPSNVLFYCCPCE